MHNITDVKNYNSNLNHMTMNKHTTIKSLFRAGVIDGATKKFCVRYNIQTLGDLLATKQKCGEFLNLYGCGMKKQLVFEQLLEMMNEEKDPVSSPTPMKTAGEIFMDAYAARITPERHKALEVVFAEMASEMSVGAQNRMKHIISDYRGIFPLIYSPHDNFATAKRLKSHQEMLALAARFAVKYEEVLNASSDYIENLLMQHQFPFLSPDEVVHVRMFKEAHGYYPLFFFALKNLQSDACQAKSKSFRFKSMFCGLEGGKSMSKGDIALSEGLTVERVRQLLDANVAKEFSHIVEFCGGFSCYSNLNKGYLTTNDAELYRIAQDELGLNATQALGVVAMVLGYNVRSLKSELYAIDPKKFSRETVSALKTAIDEEFGKMRSADVEVSVSKIVMDADLEPTEMVVNFVTSLLSHYYGEAIENGCLKLKQNCVDYYEAIYNIIAESDEPMAVTAIRDELVARNPGFKIIDLMSVRQYIYKDSRLTGIGLSGHYTLKSREGYKGTIRQFVVDLFVSKNFRPLLIDDIAVEVYKAYPNTNRRSIQSSLCDPTCDIFDDLGRGVFMLSKAYCKKQGLMAG